MSLANLNAKVTTAVGVLLGISALLLTSFPGFQSLTILIFMTGTVGGSANNYRRLQKIYLQPPIKLEPEVKTAINSQDTGQVADEKPNQNDKSIAEKSQVITHSQPKTDLENLPDDFKTMIRISIFLSPFFSGLFATILYLIFMTGIIQGDFFPQFKGGDVAYTTPYEFSINTVPKTNKDVAKALLWGFIAGFAEGLVPNFIDKVAKKAEKNNP